MPFPQENLDILSLLLGLRPDLLEELLLRRRAPDVAPQMPSLGPPPPPPIPPNLTSGPVAGNQLPVVSISEVLPLILRRRSGRGRSVKSKKISRPPGGGL